MNSIRLWAIVFLAAAAFAILPESVCARDEWIRVRSKNFTLIGDVSEKDLRKVAIKLEQFRETFSLFFGPVHVTSPIPTNVIVFKNNSAYKPFKPKRPDGRVDNLISGYFMPGDDVNYITLSTEGEDAETFATIFHEYVHFIVNTNFGKSEVPPWFNEGLAEYYQTFQIEGDQKVRLGLVIEGNLRFLKQNDLMPLDTLFNTSSYSLHQNEGHLRSIFYAESWALIHYLIQAGKSDGLGKFLTLVMKHIPAERAFQAAFQITYTEMETALRQYIAQRSFDYRAVSLETKLVFDTGMSASPLSEAETDAYLGDLLYHTHREEEAAVYLMAALQTRPDLSMANATLGMVRIRQRKYNEAKIYLEKAIAQDKNNHIALYRYAFLLSREERDEFGYVSVFSPARVEKMRDALKKAIAANPAFAESYDLLAFISLVNNDYLDETLVILQKGQNYQPGNQRFAIRIAEIEARKEQFSEALVLAEKIARTSDDPETRAQADRLVSSITRRLEIADASAAESKKNGVIESASLPIKSVVNPPTPEEQATMQNEALMRSINSAIATPLPDEERVLGSIQKIECKNEITYIVKTDIETFILTSKDLQQVRLNTFAANTRGLQFGCGTNMSGLRGVITFRPAVGKKTAGRGELVGVEFVPANFRFVDTTAARDQRPLIYEEQDPTPHRSTVGSGPDVDVSTIRRDMFIEQIKSSLLKPGPGEKQSIGTIQSSECSNKGAFIVIRTSLETIKLSFPQQNLQIRSFTPDIDQAPIGCGMERLEVPVVFIYRDSPDTKLKTAGDLISLEFVPRAFSLGSNLTP